MLSHPYDNLICTDCSPWPPAEIVQKLYQSRQTRAFERDELASCTSGIGYYCDLQSIHSEDAITWSVLGTVARSSKESLEAWLNELFSHLELPDIQTKNPEIFLWRRIPHPDTLVPGGPEIDVGISTSNALILGEAKWLSGTGAAQGKKKDKDQIQLRGEFLKKYGTRLFPDRSHFVVLGISLHPDGFMDTTSEGVTFRQTTWEEICSIPIDPPEYKPAKIDFKMDISTSKGEKAFAFGNILVSDHNDDLLWDCNLETSGVHVFAKWISKRNGDIVNYERPVFTGKQSLTAEQIKSFEKDFIKSIRQSTMKKLPDASMKSYNVLYSINYSEDGIHYIGNQVLKTMVKKGIKTSVLVISGYYDSKEKVSGPPIFLLMILNISASVCA